MQVTWIESSDSLSFKQGGTRYERLRHDIVSDFSLTTEELHYLAGFFDGEGSVGLYYSRKENRWRARISISQNWSRHAKRLMTRWAVVFGGRLYTKKQGSLELYLWDRAGLAAFIQTVGPLCAGKRQQLIIVENWLSVRTYSYRTAQVLKALKRS